MKLSVLIVYLLLVTSSVVSTGQRQATIYYQRGRKTKVYPKVIYHKKMNPVNSVWRKEGETQIYTLPFVEDFFSLDASIQSPEDVYGVTRYVPQTKMLNTMTTREIKSRRKPQILYDRINDLTMSQNFDSLPLEPSIHSKTDDSQYAQYGSVNLEKSDKKSYVKYIFAIPAVYAYYQLLYYFLSQESTSYSVQTSLVSSVSNGFAAKSLDSDILVLMASHLRQPLNSTTDSSASSLKSSYLEPTIYTTITTLPTTSVFTTQFITIRDTVTDLQTTSLFITQSSTIRDIMTTTVAVVERVNFIQSTTVTSMSTVETTRVNNLSFTVTLVSTVTTTVIADDGKLI